MAADGEAFFVGSAGLFDVDVEVAAGVGDTHGFVAKPAGVGVGDELFSGLHFGGDGVDAVDVDVGVSSDFELEAAIAFGAVSGDVLGHFFGGLLGDGAVEDEVFAVASAEEGGYGLAGDFAEDVPASHVDSGLDVGVALEGGVHESVELFEFGGVVADEVGAELLDSGADSGGVGGEVEGAEGADFAVAGDAFVGLDFDDGGVEDGGRFSAGPFVGAFLEGEVDLVGVDGGDFHRSL